MRKSLLSKFDIILQNEAERILKKLLSMYSEKIIVNKPLGEVIKELVKKELKYYSIDIELRVYSLIPYEYSDDPSNKYVLISKDEASKKHLLRYSKWCAKTDGKNHEIAANYVAKELIRINKFKTQKSLHELLSKLIYEVFPEHNDSVDARAIILYLEKELKKEGYIISSLNPLNLDDVKNKKCASLQ